MNAQERKALKRALESKENWKSKAKERKKQIRLFELRIRDLKLSRILWKEKCFNERKKPKTEKKVESTQVTKRQAKADQKKNDHAYGVLGCKLFGFFSFNTQNPDKHPLVGRY